MPTIWWLDVLIIYIKRREKILGRVCKVMTQKKCLHRRLLLPYHKYCYSFTRLNWIHVWNSRKFEQVYNMRLAHEPDIINWEQLNCSFKVPRVHGSDKIHLHKLGVVHMVSPWTGSKKGSMDRGSMFCIGPR